jgi:hypothetical protein
MKKVYVVRYHDGCGSLTATTSRDEALALCVPMESKAGHGLCEREYQEYSLVDYLSECKAAFEYASLWLRAKSADERRNRADVMMNSADKATMKIGCSIDDKAIALIDALRDRMSAIEWIDGEGAFNHLSMGSTVAIWEKSCKEWSKKNK